MKMWSMTTTAGMMRRNTNVQLIERRKTMVECKNCPYFYKGEDDDFCYCHFEGNYLAPCEEDYYEDKDCDDWDKYDEEEEY